MVVHEVPSGGERPLKLAFLGYGQREPPAEWGEAVETGVRRSAERAKAEGANVLVALVAVGRGEAKRVADAVPELTAVVVGSTKSNGEANTKAPEDERVGDVLIVQAANHLQSVAVLDLFVREPIVPGKLVRFADATGLERAHKREQVQGRIDDLRIRIAAWERDKKIAADDLRARRNELAELETQREELDRSPPPPSGSFFRTTNVEIRESLGRDPAVEGELAGYYKAVNEHNRRALADRRPAPAAPGEATYVGIEACSKCHPAPREVWQKTAHSRAYATLSTQFKEFNLECVGCHVTGYERPGGSTATYVESLKDVQCEVCHGPGSAHAVDPGDKTKIVGKPNAAICLGCHHPPHVEGFDSVAKVADILGPGHGLPLK
jgi:hypothetical protein